MRMRPKQLEPSQVRALRGDAQIAVGACEFIDSVVLRALHFSELHCV
jgi:hypothetical protein